MNDVQDAAKHRADATPANAVQSRSDQHVPRAKARLAKSSTKFVPSLRLIGFNNILPGTSMR
jgi:hypothetical protein